MKSYNYDETFTFIFDQLDSLRKNDYASFKSIIELCHNYIPDTKIRCIIVGGEGWQFRDYKEIISAGVSFEMSYSRYLNIDEALLYWKHKGINKLFKEDDTEV